MSWLLNCLTPGKKKMFKCLNKWCEAEFDEPEQIETRPRMIGNGSDHWEQEEHTEVCPDCGSEDIAEL